MKKAALYCRVSSEDQKERDTIENQVDILNTYVELNNSFDVYKSYLDNGISGTVPLEKRPEGANLIKDASKGLFDTVLVWKVDRFGRDTLSGLNAVEMLRKHNIEIISIVEPFDLNTPTGRFQFITYLNMAELERNNILDRMFLGATRAAKKGKWMGGIVPYGYIVNNDGYLHINDEEAEVIRDIYNLYVNEKMSSLSIAVYLNNQSIPSSCGQGKGKRTKGITGKWRANSIQRILSNSTYMGIHIYGKRASRRKDLIEREVPAIISKELWDKAQEVKKNNSIQSMRNCKADFLLRGLIECKECGKKYYGVSYKNKNSFYCCSGKRGDNKKIFGIKCDNKNIRADHLEETVWNGCLDILKHFNEYINELTHCNSKNTDTVTSDLDKLKKSLSDKQIEKNNILKLYRKELISEHELELQLKDIKQEETSIINLINILKQKKEISKNETSLITTMKSKIELYNERLENLSFEEKRDIVELLVRKIEVSNIICEGYKNSAVNVTFNLVKLETHMDRDLRLL